MTVYVGTLRQSIFDLQSGLDLVPALEQATAVQIVGLRRLTANVIEQAEAVRVALGTDMAAVSPNPTQISAGIFAPEAVAAIDAAIANGDQLSQVLDVHGAARRIQINLATVTR